MKRIMLVPLLYISWLVSTVDAAITTDSIDQALRAEDQGDEAQFRNIDLSGPAYTGPVAEPKDRKFYIYDWPEYIDNVWPPDDSILHERSAYNFDFRPNNGAGKLLNEELGLFQTWQFSLYRNIMQRLRTSKHRTRDPKEATSFIVPFDMGVHSYIDHNTGLPRLASPHGWMAQHLLRTAAKDDVFWHNRGHDHFVFLSITAYQMVGIGTKTFFMQICQNCTTITIETSPTKTAIKGRSRKYWYAVPYPSSFHWYEGIKKLPWEVDGERNLLALFIGSLKTSQPNSNVLRRLLNAQCKEPECKWVKTAHSCKGVINQQDNMLLLRKSVFCPAPTGDSITRKSIFDSLVAGCIPVLFSRATLSQYMWHVPTDELDKVSVYIPLKEITEDGKDFISVLKAIPQVEISKLQENIRNIAPRLQYSVVPPRAGNGSEGQTWDPPFVDAQEVIIRRILDRKTVDPIKGFSDAELLAQYENQNYIMDTHDDYAALRKDKPGQKITYKKKVGITNGMAGISKIYKFD
eukprot:GSChrysophyteH1.ASY1.ANO1.1112.1 assembled CDS